jgi:protein-disulfide isomerase-like protein with CxxC motif
MTTQTAEEIIRLAIRAMPNQLRQGLLDQAQTSYDASLETRSAVAARAMASNARACRDAADHVKYSDARAILEHCDTMVVTLNIAGKLLGLSRKAISLAAADWQSSSYANA